MLKESSIDKTILSRFSRLIAAKRLAHAYLFVGPAHVGKMKLAIDLARALNCEVPEPPCGECATCQKIAEAKHADVQNVKLWSARSLLSFAYGSSVTFQMNQYGYLTHQIGLVYCSS